MAKFVLTDAYIAINGTSYADHASSVTLDDSADEVDFTSFSTAGYKQIGPGLKDATVTVNWFADFAGTTQIHYVLQPLYQSGGTFLLEVRPTSAAVSANNPKFTMTGRLYAYNGIAGAVGEAATFETGIRNAGTAGVVWGTT